MAHSIRYRLVRTLCVFSLLLAGLFAHQGRVLCVEADGQSHVALASPLEDCSGCPGEETQPEGASTTLSPDGACGCSDIPLDAPELVARKASIETALGVSPDAAPFLPEFVVGAVESELRREVPTHLLSTTKTLPSSSLVTSVVLLL